MSDQTKKVVEDKPKTEQQRVKEFLKEYQVLCERYGYNIVVNPAFRARDDGTWSIVLQSSVGRLPKQNT